MAVQMRTGYVNPFSMKKAVPNLGQQTVRHAAGPGTRTDRVTELQTRQQALQNRILLLKASGTDSGGASEEMQKAAADELEEVTASLRSAKGDTLRAAVKPDRDYYEPGMPRAVSSGIYRAGKDAQGYKVSFSPYREK